MPNSLKIAITGPESTGKTSLSEALADYFEAPLVGEFAREYLQELGRSYELQDLDIICKSQVEAENEAISSNSKLVFCDTDITVLKIWSERKYGHLSETIESAMQSQNYDFTLLCKPDLPWEFDALREHPTQEDRDELFENYRLELELANRKYAVLTGIGTHRVDKAITLVKTFLSSI